MNYFLPEEVQSIMEEARRGLENLEMMKASRKTDLLELAEVAHRADYGRALYEAYDPDVFEAKSKVDFLFYEQLFKNAPPDERKELRQILKETYDLARQIYEFVNIKPEVYLQESCREILEAPIGEIEEKISRIIYEFLDRQFYSLTPEERSERYGNAAYGLTMRLVERGVSMEDASTLALKTVLLEKFLRQVAFPFSAWSRVSYLVESEDYGKVFDQDKLIDLVNEFERSVHRLSALISLHV